MSQLQGIARAIEGVSDALPAISASVAQAQSITSKVNSMARVSKGGVEALFETGSPILKGRAATLFTKEPVTIKWLESMVPGEVLYDVGANVGMYSVWAAKLGMQVYAFEPQAENYAQLQRNINNNKLDVQAYCVAVTDKARLDKLHVSTREVGHSCHSYGAAVSFDLTPRKGVSQGSLGLTLDDILGMGIPAPNHIKIDVDGFEHLVISGGADVLKSPSLKTLLIEVNQNLPEHWKMVKSLVADGWYWDVRQVERARRKEGPFKGCAEFLFHRISPLAHQFIAKINNAEVRTDPFPHLHIENIFPENLYRHMLSQMPDDIKYRTLQNARGTIGYPERFVYVAKSAFWKEFERFMCSGMLRQALCRKFGIETGTEEMILIRDKPGYGLGPHSDSPSKALSALFYLPKDDALIEHGTSLYRPKQEGFTCEGNKHHDRKNFERVKTIPFAPNTMLAFAKTLNSFHGVEPFTASGVRDILLFDVKA